MPEHVLEMLSAADEDVTAEVMSNSINGDLHHLIVEARHFAAVIYAPGEAKFDDGSGKGLVLFPPQEMRDVFDDFLEHLVEYTHEFTCSVRAARMTLRSLARTRHPRSASPSWCSVVRSHIAHTFARCRAGGSQTRDVGPRPEPGTRAGGH